MIVNLMPTILGSCARVDYFCATNNTTIEAVVKALTVLGDVGGGSWWMRTKLCSLSSEWSYLFWVSAIVGGGGMGFFDWME